MAELLWGQVYYNEIYAGILRQEPGDRCSFVYDASYLNTQGPPVAWTLPVREQPYISHQGLHPFFDNLVAEGWLEEAQLRLLGRRTASRFQLLLAFGQDCAGAVSIHDPAPVKLHQTGLDLSDPKHVALLKGRASLSGVQPKFTLVEEKGKFRPARSGETSTHIAKFASRGHDDLVINEYLTMQAFRALLPNDSVAEVCIDSVDGSSDAALIIKRFDRSPDGKRLHFEEFNQLLGRPSHGKYDGAYQEMADFIREAPGALPAQAFCLYLRVLAGLLLGNTDMHFKNFAMLHTPAGPRLAPSYDQVAAVLYKYKSLALRIGQATDISWYNLKAKTLVQLGRDFSLSSEAIAMAFEKLAKRKDVLLKTLDEEKQGTPALKKALIQMVKKRWNGTFSLIGQALSRKR